MLKALRLENVSDPGIRSEAQQGRRSRVDAFVTDAGVPIALLELKVGASQHGDQFARYDQIAKARGDIPRYLIALDKFTLDVPQNWKRLLLPEVLRGWRDSPDASARIIAGEAERAMVAVLDQAAGTLGQAGRVAVAVAIRHVDQRVQTSVKGLHHSSGPKRTSGGQPMLVYWLPHPHGCSQHEWLCVDVRSEASSNAQWKLRLGVEVDAESEAPAENRARELAVSLGQVLRSSAFITHLKAANKRKLVLALSSNKFDGFQARSDLGASPVFAHDRNLRLTTVTYIDTSKLTAKQLAALIVYALEYLHANA